ncbi:MAG: DUF4469 domain-containing protein [Anaerolineales bacterium]|nr:DUF4469 domain-containing protein [Anaerolineales bacterium]
MDVVGRNKPGELMFIVPAGLASGDYTLEVRATTSTAARTCAPARWVRR